MNTLTSVGPGVRAAVVPAAPGGSSDEPFPILTIARGVATSIPATAYSSGFGGFGVNQLGPLDPNSTDLSLGYGVYNTNQTLDTDQSAWAGKVVGRIDFNNCRVDVTPPADAPAGLYQATATLPVSGGHLPDGGTFLGLLSYFRLA